MGWIGTPQTWRDLGYPVYAGLATELEKAGVIFRAVGAALCASREGNLEIVPWSEESEVASIQGMDIGVMPLTDTPWTRGKCGYKLIQYMACGLPVIASPIGANREIVRDGTDGFFASEPHEWSARILQLCHDEPLRKQMGSVARKRIEEFYSLQVWSKQLGDIFLAAGNTKIGARNS
ncbi:glycosyltransferase family 4 protein [Roseinatronobacter thiooxidans]|uniref:glycosyltransferase family 4 protein n=1 Tax=Roseinatronobacter thiooxidans TaxID=121821 RepID=UPI001B86079E|nr:glycosyltransferase family 4 protein [Roseinatronobacter thiooxidans]